MLSKKNAFEKVSSKIDMVAYEENDVYFYWVFFDGLNYNNDFLSDWLHPNKWWYRIISKNIYSYLLKNKLIQND